MKTATPAAPAVPALGRILADLVELTKPRVAVLVLFTVAAGGLLAARGAVDWLVLLHTIWGTALVASGACALNQYLERDSDALMARTENRPLPAGRLQPTAVLVFGTALGILGLAYLAIAVRQPVAVLVALVTLLSYVFVYTPLKRLTWLNTLIGAVPGALPPLIGWTAVRGTFDLEGLALFLILFLWQLPHFYAIAWIYRDDYARAGMVMLPVVDRNGRRTSRQMVGFCLLLIGASLLPAAITTLGWLYLVGAALLGSGFLTTTLIFARSPAVERARLVLRASLIYLPVLLALLVLDGALR